MRHNDDRSSWLDNTLGNRPFIVAALFLASFFLPVLLLIGVPLAFIFRREPAEDWEASHYRYLTRTFFLALGSFVLVALLFVASLLMFGETDKVAIPALLVLLPLGMAGLAQFGVRSVISLSRAVARQPMPRPDSLLF
ncbi:MAG: hypothetical protein ACK4IC_01015 [Erythrobacter sp.]